MHIVGVICCLGLAAILFSVVMTESASLPGWVSVLCIAAIFALLASAVRILVNARYRRWKSKGPRTRIVLTPSDSNPPVRHHEASQD